MTSWVKAGKFWLEVRRRVGDLLRITTCCCAAPGSSARQCMGRSGNKTPCRCACHKGVKAEDHGLFWDKEDSLWVDKNGEPWA